jgi:hypothetical protein
MAEQLSQFRVSGEAYGTAGEQWDRVTPHLIPISD